MTSGTRKGRALLASLLLSRRRAVSLLAAWSVVESIPALIAGVLVAAALDDGFLAGRVLTGIGWLGLLGVAYLVGALATYRTYAPLADLVEPLRDDLTRMVVRSHLNESTTHAHQRDSRAVAQVVEQVETVRNLTGLVLRNLRPTALAAIAALVGLASLEPTALAVVAMPLLLSMAVYGLLLSLVANRLRRAILHGERVSDTAGRFVDGLRDVRASGASRVAKTTTGRAIDAHAVQLRRLNQAGALRTLVVTAGVYLPTLTLLAAAPWLLRHGSTVGEVMGAFVYLVSTLQPALQQFAQIAGSWLLRLVVTADHLANSCPTPMHDPVRATDWQPPSDGSIRIQELTFGYGRGSEPAVAGLSLEIASGEHLAVVGATGAGKSTLVNLISGLIQPQGGDILLGGSDLSKIDRAQLKRFVVLVPQQAYVFAGTLRENLTYLAPESTDSELTRAIEMLGFDRVARRLGGPQRVISPGGEGLSAGERQHIALVRVYLADAPVVLLDEATCHLDPALEAQVEQAFAQSGRTLVVVAHRMSSAMRAGRILLVDGTDAVVGTHYDLLIRSPRYASLMRHWVPA